MVCGNRCDPAIGHQLFAGNRKGTGKSAMLPADKECGKQADMGGQHPAVCTHAPDQFGVVRRLVMDACFCHWLPPSNSLLISSNL